LTRPGRWISLGVAAAGKSHGPARAAEEKRTMAASSLIIRNGTVVDGSGGAPFVADVGVKHGKIVEIGKIAWRADEEIDAEGLLVTPGFVDIHTHYDAQALWSNHIDPSSWHGVTTVMFGNCGVGFAPCKPEQRDMLVALMEGVEDIPEVVLTEGLPWNWESFPQFLDRLGERRLDMDVVMQVPHAALRVFVMGERGFAREPSSDADRREMARLTVEGIQAGALGFSTSRTIIHKTLKGEHTPTLGAAEEELAVIGEGMRQAGAGWMQVITDFDDPVGEFQLLRRVAERSGVPMSLTLAQREGSKANHWRLLLGLIEQANQDGVPIVAQILGRQIGTNFGFELTESPFSQRPSWKAIARLPFPEKLALLRTPEFRAKLLAEETIGDVQKRRLNTWDRIFVLGDPPDYEPKVEDSIAGRAARAGVPPADYAYDLMLENGGRTLLYRPVTNYVDGNLDVCAEMMRHPNTVMGLGDGGAHLGAICDAACTTHTITHWTRDRTRGPRMDLAWIIKRLTREPALAVGLNDRGVIAPGYKADLNIIDYARLRLRPLEVVYDLPANGRRLIQKSDGYVATIVSGVPTYRDGTPTAALPGRLVRGAQPDARTAAAAE
jgi:N-acyl-D-aspartate/D-glutamate deacylase